MSPENSASSERQKIRTYLSRYVDGRYRNSVIEFLPESGEFLIVIPGDVENFSEKARAMMARRLRQDLSIQTVINQSPSSTNLVISDALTKMLEFNLGDNLIHAVISISSQNYADVIAYTRDSALNGDEIAKENLKRKISDLLSAYDVNLANFFFNELADEVPTPYQIMRKLYTLAPVQLEKIQSALKLEGSPCPSAHWLKRQLDHLQTNHLVVWQQSGCYVLSAQGLAMIPGLRGRTSPDIERALAISRRKW